MHVSLRWVRDPRIESIKALNIARARPLSSYWDLFRYERDCISESETLLAQASTTAIADFVVWVLPMPWLYRARLPLHQRLGIIILFSFGLFVVVAACI